MVRLMVGRNLDLKRTETRLGDPKSRIEVRNIISPFFPTHTVSFDMRRGEILGLAGVVGCGRSDMGHSAFAVSPLPEWGAGGSGPTVKSSFHSSVGDQRIFRHLDNNRQ